jgi:hypothetical protein
MDSTLSTREWELVAGAWALGAEMYVRGGVEEDEWHMSADLDWVRLSFTDKDGARKCGARFKIDAEEDPVDVLASARAHIERALGLLPLNGVEYRTLDSFAPLDEMGDT